MTESAKRIGRPPNPPDKQTVMLTARIPAAVMARLKAAAPDDVSGAVRSAIEHWLDHPPSQA